MDRPGRTRRRADAYRDAHRRDDHRHDGDAPHPGDAELHVRPRGPGKRLPHRRDQDNFRVARVHRKGEAHRDDGQFHRGARSLSGGHSKTLRHLRQAVAGVIRAAIPKGRDEARAPAGHGRGAVHVRLGGQAERRRAEPFVDSGELRAVAGGDRNFVPRQIPERAAAVSLLRAGGGTGAAVDHRLAYFSVSIAAALSRDSRNRSTIATARCCSPPALFWEITRDSPIRTTFTKCATLFPARRN